MRRATALAAAVVAGAAVALAIWVVPAFSEGRDRRWTWVSGTVFNDNGIGTAVLSAYNVSEDVAVSLVFDETDATGLTYTGSRLGSEPGRRDRGAAGRDGDAPGRYERAQGRHASCARTPRSCASSSSAC